MKPTTQTHAPDLAPEWIEPAVSRHPGRVTATLVGAALFVRLLLVLQIAGGPLPRVHEIVFESDNAFFERWGRHIAEGDWLQREPLHPVNAWMRSVAAQAMALDPGLPARAGAAEAQEPSAVEEAIWSHWLGGATFFQEPAYPYLVGVTFALVGANVWHVFAWQLVLGGVGVVLVHRLTRRLFSETAAAAAGLLAVLAPIPLVYEVTLLRDGLVAFATVALALVMHWATGGGRARWLVLGVAFGVAALVKQSFLFFPILMALWRLIAVRSPIRARLSATGLVALGLAIAFVPAILRNLAVGVPPLAMNGSAAAMLAVHQTADANAFDILLGPNFPRVVLAADGRFLTSLIEAARTHASLWDFAALNLQKLLYAWHGFESPNNVDFYLFRQGAPVLGALPAGFVVLLPLATVGFASRRAAEAWPLVIAIVASLPTLLLAAVLSRYRAPLAAALLPLAGAGAVRIASWIAARRFDTVAVAGLASALYLAWATGDPPEKDARARASGYVALGRALELREPPYAALSFAEALRLGPDEPIVHALLGRALLASGDVRGALVHLETGARELGDPAVDELLALALSAAGRHDDAVAAVRAVLAREPGRASALDLLRRLEATQPLLHVPTAPP